MSESVLGFFGLGQWGAGVQGAGRARGGNGLVPTRLALEGVLGSSVICSVPTGRLVGGPGPPGFPAHWGGRGLRPWVGVDRAIGPLPPGALGVLVGLAWGAVSAQSRFGGVGGVWAVWLVLIWVLGYWAGGVF